MDSIAHPAPTLRYFLLDVFTEQPFSGNQLAVFVDPGSLSDGQMQRIAAELNISETVFVWSGSREGDPWRTPIFTPGVELPFAGHPTVGTAFLLTDIGRVTGVGGTVDLVLDQTVGLVPVTVTLDQGGVPVSAELVVPRASERVDTADAEELASAIGLTVEDLHDTLPVRGYSASVPFSIIPVTDTDALARARLDTSRWASAAAASPAPHLYVITPIAAADVSSKTWRARMFAPAMGIAEDPATGAAVAALAGYLRELGARRAEPVRIEQGVEMGRPSVMHLTSSPDDGEPPTVRIGGPAVVIGNGALAVPRPTSSP